jgi:formylglycine-generating enzyme required for sulfatase activity
MPRSAKPPKRIGSIISQRDVILEQYNYTSADLTRVEAQLEQILALLRENAAVRVERAGREPTILIGEADAGVRFAPRDLGTLGLLQRTDDPRRREEIYLARFVLAETYARWDRDYLPLAGLLTPAMRLSDRDDQGISPAGIPLKDVRAAITEHHKTRLVILGEPGAGKTTTLHRFALDLARERLRDPVNGKLPFRADLFKFADERMPSDFLRAEWEATGLRETYGLAIAQGQVCFLLDGVNQMPMADRSTRIERWAHWANADLPPGNWAVFTCRTADYMPRLQLPQVHIQALDRARMRQYFEMRFAERAPALWRDFEARLDSRDDRFERLAANPFMLSLLADRCAEGKPLTDSRARLMDDLASGLIERELHEGRQPETLTADPRGTLAAAMTALSRLAFAVQAAHGEGKGYITRTLAQEVTLTERDQTPLTLDEVLDLAQDATVLQATEVQRQNTREPGFSFYHHLLQEYFAARELLRQFRAGKNLAKYWRVPWRTWQLISRPLLPGEALAPPPTTGWEETVMLVAGLAGKDAPRFIAAVRKDNLPLAGRCLAEAGVESAELKSLAEETRAALLLRQRSSAAHLRARMDAGLALGSIGHPELIPQKFEFEGRTVWAIVPPMQNVPAGEFIRGSARGDPHAFSNQYTTERRITLDEFSIGRYPVTNAEYAWFIQDGGYQTDRWWSEEGRAWKQGGPDAHARAIQDWLALRAWLKKQHLEQIARRWNWEPRRLAYWKQVTQLDDASAEKRAREIFERSFDRPGFWDDRNGLASPARPVVGVNWYEAEAYCNWLSAITGHAFRLPREMEWEKAARGTDGREYPWGEKFDSTLCNTNESYIYTTTPVGLYPGGISPFGVFDASGNVWEWTGDWYEMYPGGEPSDDFGEKYRVVRGGSWGGNRVHARCGCRGGLVPVYFPDVLGFRLCSPGSIPAF